LMLELDTSLDLFLLNWKKAYLQFSEMSTDW
jgi:hypothetical protein